MWLLLTQELTYDFSCSIVVTNLRYARLGSDADIEGVVAYQHPLTKTECRSYIRIWSFKLVECVYDITGVMVGCWMMSSMCHLREAKMSMITSRSLIKTVHSNANQK